MILYSPLDQFEIKIIFFNIINKILSIYYYIFKIDNKHYLILNVFSIYSFLTVFCICFFLSISSYTRHIVPKNGWELFSEKIFSILKDVVFQNFANRFWRKRCFPFFFTIFFFILVSNLLGLTPFGFTNTSFAIGCLSISVSIFFSLTLLGIFIQGSHFFEHFIPKGIPIALLPMLVVIEIISYISKAFSLSIRLFANMMSGHILLNILSNFSLKLTKFSILVGIIPFIIVLAISFLEVGICLLQAYVFMILLILYLNDSCKFDNKFYSEPYLMESLSYWCYFRGLIVADRNDLKYQRIIIKKLLFAYEFRIFYGKVYSVNEEANVSLFFKKPNYTAILDYRLDYEEEHLYDLYNNEIFNIKMIHFFFTREVLSYSLLHKCKCQGTFMTWYGRYLDEEEIKRIVTFIPTTIVW